ncbi:MAG: ABC transporter ATP-binding protein, partial [Nitrospirae bacterium]|nr:ABC transporter ATP-binding protein [Nitrospirota bacterium]
VAICRTLQQLRGGMTILAVSHQPALVEAADRVYRLEKGALTLVADGVPDSAVPCDVGDEPTLTSPG